MQQRKSLLHFAGVPLLVAGRMPAQKTTPTIHSSNKCLDYSTPLPGFIP
jgi:hypothetical protein